VEENSEYREAVWADALEGVDPSAPVDDEDEYDELDELEGGGGKNKRRRKAASSKAKSGVLPKKFLPRTLASVLIEEASREDGVAKEFLNAEARLPRDQQLPRRKFCPVTGMVGIYTEPRSNIPYANLRALEQIRERPPPWMTLGGSAAFLEATKSIRDEEGRAL
jgi:YL1 nuclear protein C-terminal domain